VVVAAAAIFFFFGFLAFTVLAALTFGAFLIAVALALVVFGVLALAKVRLVVIAGVKTLSAPGVELAVQTHWPWLKIQATPGAASLYAAVSSNSLPSGSSKVALPAVLLNVRLVSLLYKTM
jgi:hypothetical protein